MARLRAERDEDFVQQEFIPRVEGPWMRNRLWIVALLVAPCLTALSGCGGGSGANTAHLQGTLTIDGQPIPADANAIITFMPVDRKAGKPGVAKVEGGSYDCPEVPKGAVKVYFSIDQPTGPEITDARGLKGRANVSLVPPKYAGGMDFEVTDDETRDFNLEKG
jgi:hypothetical protein